MTSSTKPLVLVTGGTGFIGSYVVDELLKANYPVRAVVRTGKTATIKNTHQNAGNLLDVVEISDIAAGDLTQLFKGVGALIHVATPTFASTVSAEDIFRGALHGMLNVVNAALKAGVKQIVYTSSFTALGNPDFKLLFGTTPVNETSWGNIAQEELDTSTQSSEFVYVVSKSLAEKKLWEVALEHPDVEFTTILPPSVYGPWLENYPLPTSRVNLGSNEFIYSLIADGPNTYCRWPVTNGAHVRDIARSHVLALSAPQHINKQTGAKVQKRLIVSQGRFTWVQAADLVRGTRPELSDRLPSSDSSVAVPTVQTTAELDTSLTTEVLGMTVESYVSWEQYVLDTVDALVAWEQVTSS